MGAWIFDFLHAVSHCVAPELIHGGPDHLLASSLYIPTAKHAVMQALHFHKSLCGSEDPAIRQHKVRSRKLDGCTYHDFIRRLGIVRGISVLGPSQNRWHLAFCIDGFFDRWLDNGTRAPSRVNVETQGSCVNVEVGPSWPLSQCRRACL